MSPQPASESDVQEPRKNAGQRLKELRSALQRQLKRKPSQIERTALDRAALLTLRAEMAAFDPKADSNDVVRLDNAARRARQDFERIARIEQRSKRQRSMADIEKELASHV